MERRFCLGQVSFQPETQLFAELRRCVIRKSLALTIQNGPPLEFGQPFRCLFHLGNRRLLLSQLFLDQFGFVLGLVWGPILERFFVVFAICFACSIHLASPFTASVISFRPTRGIHAA